jgi:hypothetical protein
MRTHQPFDVDDSAPDRALSRATGSSAARFLATALIVVAAAAMPAPPVPADEAQGLMDILRKEGGETDPEKVFAIIDKDGDGKVTRAEFTERKMEIFFLRDVNRDTRLSRDEFSTISQAAFDSADLDGDGMLSTFEFDQASFAKFEAVDANGDGVITLEEFLAFRLRLN